MLIKVFPNPANTYLSISIETKKAANPMTLIISDISGRQVYRFQPLSAPGHHLVDTRKWNEGLYLYQLRDNQTLIGSGKFIIRH